MIYLLDGGGQHVGPFKNRENVERFIEMMALCGENWAENKIVERGVDDTPGQNPAPMDSCVSQSKRTNKLMLVGRKP